MSVKKKYSETEPLYRRIFTGFLVCVVFAVLFAVRLHVENIGADSQKLFSNNDGLYADWFLYCKELLIFIVALIIAVYFIGEKIFPDKPCRNNPIFQKPAVVPAVLIGIYFLAAVVSAVFSEHKDVVLWGICSEYEGIIAVFSYCLLFLAGYNYFSGEKTFGFYKKAFFVLIAVTVVLSFFEYTVMPLMELPFMKYIIASPEYRSVAESLDFSNGREAVLMFFNSNYMGGFCTMIFPVSVYYVVVAEKIYQKILCSVLSAACFIVTVMSDSTAAFYVVLAEIIFITIFLAVKKLISLKNVLMTVLSFLVLAGALSAATGSVFMSDIAGSIVNSGGYNESSHPFKIDDVHIEGNTIVFSGGGSEYRIIAPVEDGEKLEIQGGEGTEFKTAASDSNTITVYDVRNDFDFSVILRDGIIYLDLGYISTVDFAVTSEGINLIVQNKQLLDSIPYSSFNDSVLSKFYSVATGRGYTWINTLPILKKCLIIGKGSGNFPFYFKQNDLVGLLNIHGTYRLIVDKPHNWYLQIAVTCGIPAMTAVLILFAYFAVSGFRGFFRTSAERLTAEKDTLFLAFLFTGLCGFMVMGLTNDSCITVNPLFWFSFGIAFMRTDRLRKGDVSEKN